MEKNLKFVLENIQTMKKTGLIYLSFCLFLFLFSCNNNRDEKQLLDGIEQTWQLSETSLQEAKARAEGLRDSVLVSSEYVRQKYDLLSIRLRDKSYIIPSSPDSALHTMTYFEERDNAVDKERAYYYLGSAYRDLSDYPRAVNFFQKSVDIAKECKQADTILWQKGFSQLRNLYMLQLNYEEELNVALQSVELAKKSGKNLGWYLIDAASAYEHLKDTLRMLQYCDQSYQVIQKEHFPPKYGEVLANMLAIYAKTLKGEDVRKLDTLLQQLTQLPEPQRPHNYELGLALYYENENLIDSAILHYKTFYGLAKTISGRYEASAGLQRCYREKQDFPQAVEWGCRLYDTNDSIIDQRAFEETQRARDTYSYYRDQEKEQALVQRDERIKSASIITGLALLSVVLGLLLLYFYRKKKLMEEIIAKDKELEQRAMTNRELTRIALMHNATDNAEDVIARFRKTAVGRAKLDDDSWKDLMGTIETLYPGFHEAIQGRLQGNLSEQLIRTICLMKIGMKPAQIAQVMDARIQTVWNRVKRAEETCGDLISASLL